jgi:hypothetical protein
MSFGDLLNEIDEIMQPSLKPLSEGQKATLRDHRERLLGFLVEKKDDVDYLTVKANRDHFNRVRKIIFKIDMLLSAKR